jgi:hypothetical protein
MDYKKIYNSLMSSRIDMKDKRKLEKKNGNYFERHHIIPISLGGNKSYSLRSDNIVLLTAREHYLAHRILWLIYRSREMGFAFHRMVFSESPLQTRNFNSKAYEAARIALSECQRGEKNPMYGKVSPFKGKTSVNKGKKLGSRPYQSGEKNPAKNEEVRKKISNANKGMTNPKGEKNPAFGGYKILLKNGKFIGKFENLVDMLELVPCSIHNLKSHIKNGKGGIIKGGWQVFYEKDYFKRL